LINNEKLTSKNGNVTIGNNDSPATQLEQLKQGDLKFDFRSAEECAASVSHLTIDVRWGLTTFLRSHHDNQDAVSPVGPPPSPTNARVTAFLFDFRVSNNLVTTSWWWDM
jgi:hypothetical protein